MTDAFGVVALVALTPLIAIQIMGIQYQLVLRKGSDAEPAARREIVFVDDDIFDFEEEEEDDGQS